MDVVRVSNNISINDSQQQQQQQQNSKPKDTSSNRNGLNQSTPQLSNNQFNYASTPKQSASGSQLAPGSVTSSGGSLGSDGQHQASSDSGNSSCISGSSGSSSGGGGGGAVDDPETKNISFGSSVSDEVRITPEKVTCERDDEKGALLKRNLYVNKIYDDSDEVLADEGIDCGEERLNKLAVLEGRGSSTETDENAEEVKPLLQASVDLEKRKPKSIVKSPSNLSFGKEANAASGGGAGGVQKQRLNLQFQQPVESILGDRPVLHVQ